VTRSRRELKLRRRGLRTVSTLEDALRRREISW
jgi:hypothetical protein